MKIESLHPVNAQEHGDADHGATMQQWKRGCTGWISG
jgi:hypothetical protein